MAQTAVIITDAVPHTAMTYNPKENTEYLRNDQLQLRVKEFTSIQVPLISKETQWQDSSQSVFKCTVSDFNKRRYFNSLFVSAPFYTHTNGYKFCLQVETNGDGSGRNTHLSVFTVLLKGEHDDKLKWPLQCNMVVELLNWREDKGHHKATICFDGKSEHSYHVTASDISINRDGLIKYISQSSLAYNPATNTEYLQDDCLRFRIKVEEWQDSHSNYSEDTLEPISSSSQSYTSKYTHDAIDHTMEIKISKLIIHEPLGSGKSECLDLILEKEKPCEARSSASIIKKSQIVRKRLTFSDKLRENKRLAVSDDLSGVVDDEQMIEIVWAKIMKNIDVFNDQYKVGTGLSTADTSLPDLSDDNLPIFSQRAEILAQLLDELLQIKASNKLCDAHWVYIIDTGGHPFFEVVAPLFVRYNSLNLITLKMNERLDHKPDYVFYIDDKPFHMADSSLQQTNLEIIESQVKSLSVSPLSLHNAKFESDVNSEPEVPKYAIIGLLDEAGGCEETPEVKEDILKERLKLYDDHQVMSGIFRVNAASHDKQYRKRKAKELQDMIKVHTIKVDVPVRWFGLLLELLLQSMKQSKCVLSLEECLDAGASLGMNKEETLYALNFLHELTVLFYFDTDMLRGSVFIDMQPIFEMLLQLIGISFIDEKALCEMLQYSLSTRDRKAIKAQGIFDRKIVRKLKFLSNITADLFLHLLEHLMVIASLTKKKFFLLCVLPSASEQQIRERVGDNDQPWVVRLSQNDGIRRDTIPIPKGLFLIVVVHLLKCDDIVFPNIETQQYQNTVSLEYEQGGIFHIAETHGKLQIYYTHRKQQLYSNIRSLVLEGVSIALDKLGFSHDTFIKKDCFHCPCSEDPHLCVYNENAQSFECEKCGAEQDLGCVKWTHSIIDKGEKSDQPHAQRSTDSSGIDYRKIDDKTLVMQDADKAAYNTLTELLPDLCGSAFQPLKTAVSLLAQAVVGQNVIDYCGRGDVIDYQKRLNIIQAVQANRAHNVFQKFIAILEKDGENSDIVAKLKEKYANHGGKLRVSEYS